MLIQTISNAHAENQLVGISLSGAEFASSALPGKQGFDYLWPTPEDIQRFASAGFNVFRIPFLWERMQPELNQALNDDEAHYLDIVIQTAYTAKVKIVIDPHNFGGYRGQLIGSDKVTVAAFQDFWRRLAERYKKYPNVIFALMNEPNRQGAAEWAKMAQAAIDAIRQTEAKQLILVPGTYWSGAHSWSVNQSGISNADALKNIHDNANNFAFEMHQYFDVDSSGTHKTCVSANVGVERLKNANLWLKQHQFKAFLGEFGATNNDICLAALTKTLEYLKVNADVWLGWAYWSASKWSPQYMFDIYPLNQQQSKQFSVMTPYLNKPVSDNDLR